MSNLKDPKVIGPGIWWSLHTIAADANTPEKKLLFLNYLKIIKDKFPCLECKNHLNEFINKNNPNSSQYSDLKGLFKWSWECHNNANLVSGKKLFLYSDAEKLYYSPEFCTTSCSSNISNKPVFKSTGVVIRH